MNNSHASLSALRPAILEFFALSEVLADLLAKRVNALHVLVLEELRVQRRQHALTHLLTFEGKSGPLKNEITWKELQLRSGCPYPINEYTTVTGRLRRIATFDLELIQRSAMINRPTELVFFATIK